MADGSVDFAVFGSTPLAGLVAGLLAAEHHRRVCLVGARWSPFRLPRRFDLSIAPVTRPETWALLNALTIETTRLLGSIGRNLTDRIDPLAVAETPASIAAVSHMRHVAAGYGYAAERLADRSLTESGMVLRLRDVVLLSDSRAGPAIAAWLERLGVAHVDPQAARISLRRDGGARLAGDGLALDAARAVLADDAAILQHLGDDEIDPVLRRRRATAVLSEPAPPLKAPLVSFLDRDTVLLQRHRGDGILALGGGPEAEAMPRIGASLGALGPLHRAAQAGFDTLATADGAPLVGPARGLRAIVIAGFGNVGAFFAPAIARHLAGAGTGAEKAWFAERGPARGGLRPLAADFVRNDGMAVTA